MAVVLHYLYAAIMFVLIVVVLPIAWPMFLIGLAHGVRRVLGYSDGSKW